MNFPLYAHRLGRAYGPDSSLEALRGSLKFGIEGVETDCLLTLDQKIVLLHGPCLEDETTISGWAHQKTLKEIVESNRLANDGTAHHEHPMTLQELADHLPTDVGVQLEVKSWSDQKLAAQTTKVLCVEAKEIFKNHKVEVISFWDEACQIAAQAGFDTRLIISCLYNPQNLAAYCVEKKITGITLEAGYWDEQVIEPLRAKGISIASGNINDPHLLSTILHHEPDLICTDMPDVLRASFLD